jgi:hypothetical protein
MQTDTRISAAKSIAYRFTRAVADEVAAQNNANASLDPSEDRWAYTAIEHGPHFIVQVADESGYVVGYL